MNCLHGISTISDLGILIVGMDMAFWNQFSGYWGMAVFVYNKKKVGKEGITYSIRR